MSIGKPKNDPIDLNGLMNEIENDHRITVESDAIDKHIEELRAAQKDLRQATETLEKATMTLNGAIAALKSATDNSTNIVTGINNVSIRPTTGIKPLYTTIATVTMNLIVSAAIVLLNPYVTVYISYKIPPFALSVHIPDVSTSIYVEVDSKVLLGLPSCDKAFVR